MNDVFWDREKIVYAMWLWYRRKGEWPKTTDWRETSNLDHPSQSTVYKHFKSWKEALNQAKSFELEIFSKKAEAIYGRLNNPM